GGALEALLHARTGDDSRTITEPKRRAKLALLVPEGGDPVVELLQLGGNTRGPALRATRPDGAPPGSPPPPTRTASPRDTPCSRDSAGSRTCALRAVGPRRPRVRLSAGRPWACIDRLAGRAPSLSNGP